MEDHQKFMKICLKLASQAKENGFTPVGSVIVKDGEVISEGMEGSDELPQILSHAENVSILHAVEKLNTKNLEDCVLYTTVEPCFMCSYLIRQMKIKKVVYGLETPAGGKSSDYPILTTDKISSWSKPPEIRGGVMKEECKKLFES